MSITYDPKKWTSSLRARDFEEAPKKSKSLKLVSISDTRYFKVKNRDAGDEKFRRFLSNESGLPDESADNTADSGKE